MKSDRNYFPWHTFQLWFREGFRAGAILNKVMVASWSKEQRQQLLEQRRFAAINHPEELDLLREVAQWLRTNGKEGEARTIDERLAKLAPYTEYPPLSDEEARTLWRILSEYGVSTERYRYLHGQVRAFVAGFGGDTDKAIQGVMDAIWRSMGPALDPIRENVEKAAKEEAA